MRAPKNEPDFANCGRQSRREVNRKMGGCAACNCAALLIIRDEQGTRWFCVSCGTELYEQEGEDDGAGENKE